MLGCTHPTPAFLPSFSQLKFLHPVIIIRFIVPCTILPISIFISFHYFVTHQTETLVTVLLRPHGEFLTWWCSSNLPKLEEDSILEYDSFATTGWVLDIFSSSDQQYAKGVVFTSRSIVHPSYAHQRTSLLVKIIANLHCFIPNVCEGMSYTRC